MNLTEIASFSPLAQSAEERCDLRQVCFSVGLERAEGEDEGEGAPSRLAWAGFFSLNSKPETPLNFHNLPQLKAVTSDLAFHRQIIRS